MRRGLGIVLLAVILLLSGCAGTERTPAPETHGGADHGMALQYAEGFTVDYDEAGRALVTIAGEDRFLIVPEGVGEPAELDADVTVLCQPIRNIYVATSAAMDLFDRAGALDCVRMTATRAADWSLPAVRRAMEEGDVLFAGKYSAPDYELLLAEGCSLAIENTMVYHTPKIKEELESLGIPVLVERSSYETHPLGRMEWIKLYGLLTGRTEEAERFFDGQAAAIQKILNEENTGKTVAFFYISSNGYVNVRRSGDYLPKMIELAGGRYVLTDIGSEEDGARSTMNMQAEAFYAAARDADVLIYNANVDGGMSTLDELLEKADWLADFRAVRSGNVWCTEQNLFQESSGAAGMIRDFHSILTGEADGERQLTYLRRLQ